MTRLVQLQPIEPRATRGARATFGESAGAMFRREQEVGELTSRPRFEREIYQPLLDQMKVQRFGPGPARVEIQGQALSAEIAGRLTAQEFAPDEGLLTDLFAELDERGIKLPEDVTPETLIERRERMTQGLLGRVEREDEVLARSHGLTGFAGQLTGGFMAGFDNIESVVTMPIGAASRAGILATALIEGGVAAATEAGTTPTRNRFLRELGLPEESILANAAFGFAVGGVLGGSLRSLTRLGEAVRDRRPALIETAEATGDAELEAMAQSLTRDVEDEEAGASDGDPGGTREHLDRAQQGAQAAREGVAPDMPDRPTFATPRATIVDGALQEFTPDELEFDAGTFQWKSDVTGEQGQRGVLDNQERFDPTLAGPVFIYERADGRLVVVDGHQRTGLAKRAQDAGQDVRMAGYVWREADGHTTDEVFARGVIADLSQREEFAAGMVRDAARALRIDPDLVKALPKGPGHLRLQRILALPDEAFDAVIHGRLAPNMAELIPQMIQDAEMQNAVAKLLTRLEPANVTQAQSIIAQAREAPASRETTVDLFGEQEVVESLYLERAKVLDRALKTLRDDRSVFRTLDERAERIQGTGGNRLDEATNKQTRQQVEQALVTVQKLAHRAGPISEALNDGAKAYKETGRLKDAGETVAAAVRRAIDRGDLGGGADRPRADTGAPSPARADAPDPALEGFSDPVEGEGAKAQIEATRIEPEPEPQIDRLEEMEPADVAQLEAGLKAAQGLRDIDDLMERGARNHAELTTEIEVAAQNAGVTARAAPLKGRARAEKKISVKYGGVVNKVTDVARGGVDAPDPGAADAFVAALARRYRVVDEGYAYTEAGYFDRKLTVVFDDGQLGEVQIWPPGMFEAKERRGGHAMYEEWRLPETPEARKSELAEQMRALYGEALAALPPSWSRISGGGDAPTAARTASASDAGTSRDRSSESTARAVSSRGADQASPVQTDATLRTSETAASSAASNRTSFMGDTSRTDISDNGRVVNVERTSAGEQGLFDGVEPITERTRLDQQQAAPIEGGSAADDTEIGGLFDTNDPSRFDLFDAVPVGRGFDADGNEISVVKSRADIAAELDADDEALGVLDLCVKG